jgi:hypothetical protein
MYNNITRIISTAILAVGLMASGFSASAATISMLPAVQNVADGATFSVEIWAFGLPVDTVGGALDITWNTADMTLNTFYIATTDPQDSNGYFSGPWDDVASFGSGVDTVSPGMLEGLFVTSFGGVTGDAPIARLNFTLGTGVTNSMITLAEAAIGGMWANDDPVNGPMAFTNTYSGATINPAAVIPVPAAIWLFGSGLVGLAGVARRRG